ncbi:MAG: glycoside hydrolase family 97 protein, partial [Bacteroidaceae bacterium]|nr:glycoside hydrolase family 97 protein [Bacteroidaceae bacterium]
MTVSAMEHKVTSPDGKLVVTVSDTDGKAQYSVNYNGNTFLLNSPLGMKTNIGDFSEGLTLQEEFETSVVEDEYSLSNIKKSHVEYKANQAKFDFFKEKTTSRMGRTSTSNDLVFSVVFNVSNNDIAFRYIVAQPKGGQYPTQCCIINEEMTGFRFPEGTTTFLCPQMRPLTGFARTAPSYETDYALDAPMGDNAGGLGFVFPGLFHVANGWVLVSETGVSSAYCASRLNCQGNLYTVAFPLPEENNGNGNSAPGIVLPDSNPWNGVSEPGATPWRTITLGETLQPIAETTIAWDVVKPLYEASQKYEPGRAVWSWIIYMNDSGTYEEEKDYIDMAATMGYEYILIDANWHTIIGYDKMEELVKYATSKNVGVVLWYNSNGYWNDAPQGPRGALDNIIARNKEMAWLQKIGVKGLKIDFWGGDKQMTMQLYEEILYDANRYGLQLIFHGCTLPRGWERMYPNFASAEAVRASENLSFGQYANDIEAVNGALHPFIRNTVASMDFGGSALNKFYNRNNRTGNHRVTSDVYALATSILFQSPIQHIAIAPNNLTDAPAWAIEFLKEIPTTWDDIKFIDGYPGKYAIMARRHGDKWYIMGVNAADQAYQATLTLDMFPQGATVRMYS